MTDAKTRRAPLINAMDGLEHIQVTCKDCEGTCCTYKSNSMLITPLETWELVQYFKIKNWDKEQIKETLVQNISEYRLDKELLLPGKGELRRTYTCPFFSGGELGCTISPSHKPYGCLGFNAVENGEKAVDCQSDLSVLEKRDEAFSEVETELNEKLRKKWNLYWQKKPIPVALMECLDPWWDLSTPY